MKPMNVHTSPLRPVILPVLLSALCLLGGCSEDGGDGQAAATPPAANAPAGPAPAGGPTVQVAADKTHAVQPGDVITLTVSVTDFALDAAAMGSARAPGRGHFRVYLDDASGDAFLAESADANLKVKIPEDVTDGSHDLRVMLYNNDRTPFEPDTRASVLLIVYRL